MQQKSLLEPNFAARQFATRGWTMPDGATLHLSENFIHNTLQRCLTHRAALRMCKWALMMTETEDDAQTRLASSLEGRISTPSSLRHLD